MSRHMRTMWLALLCALPVAGMAATPTDQHAGTLDAAVAQAVNDPARTADKVDDARRKVAQIMLFAQVKPGQKVLELLPGKGYFTRVFSALVGPAGRVYTVWPQEAEKFSAKAFAQWTALAATPHYANVTLLQQPAAKLTTPEPVDLVFTSQNYHDYPDSFMGNADPAALDRQAFAALKPGGLFVVIDHVAAAGHGLADTETLHRIDPATVRAQVEAAGFTFDGESDALRNSADPHTAKVFDPSIRGHTDQFIYRFRKPLQ